MSSPVERPNTRSRQIIVPSDRPRTARQIDQTATGCLSPEFLQQVTEVGALLSWEEFQSKFRDKSKTGGGINEETRRLGFGFRAHKAAFRGLLSPLTESSGVSADPAMVEGVDSTAAKPISSDNGLGLISGRHSGAGTASKLAQCDPGGSTAAGVRQHGVDSAVLPPSSGGQQVETPPIILSAAQSPVHGHDSSSGSRPRTRSTTRITPSRNGLGDKRNLGHCQQGPDPHCSDTLFLDPTSLKPPRPDPPLSSNPPSSDELSLDPPHHDPPYLDLSSLLPPSPDPAQPDSPRPDPPCQDLPTPDPTCVDPQVSAADTGLLGPMASFMGPSPLPPSSPSAPPLMHNTISPHQPFSSNDTIAPNEAVPLYDGEVHHDCRYCPINSSTAREAEGGKPIQPQTQTAVQGYSGPIIGASVVEDGHPTATTLNTDSYAPIVATSPVKHASGSSGAPSSVPGSQSHDQPQQAQPPGEAVPYVAALGNEASNVVLNQSQPPEGSHPSEAGIAPCSERRPAAATVALQGPEADHGGLGLSQLPLGSGGGDSGASQLRPATASSAACASASDETMQSQEALAQHTLPPDASAPTPNFKMRTQKMVSLRSLAQGEGRQARTPKRLPCQAKG